MLMFNLHVSLICMHTEAKTVLLLYVFLDVDLERLCSQTQKLSEHVKQLQRLLPNSLVPSLKVKAEFMKQKGGHPEPSIFFFGRRDS